MKKVYVFVLLNMILFNNGFAQTFEWAKREGLWQYDYGYGVAADKKGNILLTGKYEMEANFSGTTIPCAGNHDMYLASYKPDGTLNWITTAGGPHGDYTRALSTDGESFIYVAGEIEDYGPMDFGNNVVLTGRGDNDAFVAKYDMNGKALWARSAGGKGSEKAMSVAHDNAGNVYVVGRYTDTAYFNNKAYISQGSLDIFIMKYDANGNFKWVKTAGSPSRDEALAVKCDEAGNMYVCGMYRNGCVFGNTTLSAPKSYFNTFLAKYDPNGNLVWVKTGGGDYDDVAWGITIDKSGKVYMAGEFNAYATWGSQSMSTAGNSDAFVICYDQSGNVQWAKKAGGPLIDRARGIGTDGQNLYITGQFGASATFGSTKLNAADSSDVFIAALSNAGNFQWALAAGGPKDSIETLGYESGNAICTDASGYVYATGSIITGATFGNISLSGYSRTDVFLTKIKHSGVIITPTDIASAGSGSFSLYPNPGTGHFRLQLPQSMSSKVEVNVYNMLGQSVMRKQFENASDIPLDLSANGKGVYMVKVRSGEEEVNTKLVIQ